MSVKIHRKPTIDYEDNDKPRDECGVFGVYTNNTDAARLTFFALYALQHRGQESAGIASQNGDEMFYERGMGLVSQVFTEDKMKNLLGNHAIGHVRYSTFGASNLENCQPFLIETNWGRIGVAHNGQLTKGDVLRKKLLNRGVGMFRNSDSEVMAQLLALPIPDKEKDGPDWVARISALMKESDGAYALVVLTKDAVYAARDMYGLRPLCIGSLIENEGYIVASESCAIQTIGAQYLREVKPGEIVKIDNTGLKSFVGREPAKKPAFCVFEYVYFSRPDSMLEDQLVHTVRQRLGEQLAIEHPPPKGASMVMGVPDSSIPAAIGYAAKTGLMYNEGLCKNRYIGRTFIQPGQELRKNAISLKYNPLYSNLKGRDIIVIDDSIVRGNTLNKLCRLLRSAGAKSVHVRISSPPVTNPCFMGIAISGKEELIAHTKSVDEIAKHIGADSLGYLSHDGMIKAVQEGLKSPEASGHCSACFTGKYPLQVEW